MEAFCFLILEPLCFYTGFILAKKKKQKQKVTLLIPLLARSYNSAHVQEKNFPRNFVSANYFQGCNIFLSLLKVTF